MDLDVSFSTTRCRQTDAALRLQRLKITSAKADPGEKPRRDGKYGANLGGSESFNSHWAHNEAFPSPKASPKSPPLLPKRGGRRRRSAGKSDHRKWKFLKGSKQVESCK